MGELGGLAGHCQSKGLRRRQGSASFFQENGKIIEEGGGFCNGRGCAKAARGEERKMAEERVTTVGDRLEA